MKYVIKITGKHTGETLLKSKGYDKISRAVAVYDDIKNNLMGGKDSNYLFVLAIHPIFKEDIKKDEGHRIILEKRLIAVQKELDKVDEKGYREGYWMGYKHAIEAEIMLSY